MHKLIWGAATTSIISTQPWVIRRLGSLNGNIIPTMVLSADWATGYRPGLLNLTHPKPFSLEASTSQMTRGTGAPPNAQISLVLSD
jgi:hypothetical protein